MFLKNYTSKVPVGQSIFRIEQVLVACKVTGVTKTYAVDQSVEAVIFHVPGTNGTPLSVRLPANVDRVWNVLWEDYTKGERVSADGTQVYSSRKQKRKADFKDQAERTAWKLIQDWVEVQMSLILMKQAETTEVFMPYLWDAASGQTLFQKLEQNGFRALLPERAES